MSLLPDFICIGTQKGGTTTLQKLFENDLRFFLPSCKEVQYFSLNSHQSVEWYQDHFLGSKQNQLRGEITPYYLFHPESAARIKNLIPKVLLIVLLRDPVERALSQYFHAVRHGFEPLEIEAAFEAEEIRLQDGNAFSHQKHSYVSRSRYLEQLDRFEDLFPSKQILILKSEEFFTKPNPSWIRIQEFLGLKSQLLKQLAPHANAGKGESREVPIRIRTKLKEELYETVLGVQKRYGIDWNW